MSVVGHVLWMEMQDKGPYSRAAFARLLTNNYGYPTTHQSISNYLRRDRPPVDFLNAALDALRASEEKKEEVRRLYFTGQRESGEAPKGPYPGGARTEQGFDQALDYEAERRARRRAEENGDEKPSGSR